VALFLVFELGLRCFYWFAIEDLEAPYGCGGPVALSRMNFLYHTLAGTDLFSEGLVVHDSNRGYKLAPDLRDFPLYPERDATLSTNSVGVRGAREFAASPPSGVRRIVAIGDSFTFGENVGDDETWPAQLEALLGDAEVLNLGVFAYSHDQAALALRDDGLPYAPGIVLLGYVDDDLNRNLCPFFCFAKPVPDLDGPEPFAGIPVESPSEIRRGFWYRSFIVETFRMAWQTAHYALPSYERQTEAGAFLLRMMRELTEEAGARFIVVRMVGREELEPYPREFIMTHVEAEGVEFVDPRPGFKAVLDRQGPEAYEALFLPDNSHPSAAGYQIMAEAVARYLEAHPEPRR